MEADDYPRGHMESLVPPAPPCLNVHPTLGSRCELLVPHVNHAGWRPGTGDVVTWKDEAPVETRAQRWRREHRGYGQPSGHEHDSYTQDVMMRSGRTSDASNAGWKDATNGGAKLASEAPPFIPSMDEVDCLPDAGKR